MSQTNLQENNIEKLPKSCGVYLLKDSKGKVIYVGKAKDIYKRVTSHQQKKNINFSSVDYIVTASELEALILESNLIKVHKPRYNVRLRDDKAYPILKLTKEQYPALQIVRRFNDDDAHYFGPYSDSHSLRQTIRLIKELLGIRTCRYPSQKLKNVKPCLSYHLNQCLGPCKAADCGYDKAVKNLLSFFSGDYEEIIKRLHRCMERAASKLQFEEAKVWRDKIYALERIMTKQRVVFQEKKHLDVITAVIHHNNVCVNLTMVREGRLIGQHNFIFDVSWCKEDDPVFATLSTFLKQYYIRISSPPPRIALSHQIEDIPLIREYFQHQGYCVDIGLYVCAEEELVKLSVDNGRFHLLQSRPTSDTLEALKLKLDLQKKPTRIEAFDTSTIRGRHSTASVVVFKDGVADKSEYRKFKISSGAKDDVSFIYEVVKRRYSKWQANDVDLILIDGGRQQLVSAQRALAELGLEHIPVCAIAKAPEGDIVYTATKKFKLDVTEPCLLFLQRIRDESHRFAIKYHKYLRKKVFFG